MGQTTLNKKNTNCNPCMTLHMVTRSVSPNVLRHGIVSLCYD